MCNEQESPEFTRMVLELMTNAGITGASYIKLAEAGIENPDAYVAQLRIDGAVIKEKKRTILAHGVIWEDISHYIYKRWNDSEPVSDGSNFTQKSNVVSITDGRPKDRGNN
jgi:hypothetical protein